LASARDEFDRLIDVNIKGVAKRVAVVSAGDGPRQSGVVVNFSSGWGRSTSPDVASLLLQ